MIADYDNIGEVDVKRAGEGGDYDLIPDVEITDSGSNYDALDKVELEGGGGIMMATETVIVMISYIFLTNI